MALSHLSRYCPAPHEGEPLSVLLGPRALADYHHEGIEHAHAGHGVRSPLVEGTEGAGAHLPLELGEGALPGLGVVGGRNGDVRGGGVGGGRGGGGGAPGLAPAPWGGCAPRGGGRRPGWRPPGVAPAPGVAPPRGGAAPGVAPAPGWRWRRPPGGGRFHASTVSRSLLIS